MIPKNIKREHVIRAIEEVEKVGIPKDRGSRKFLLEYNGRCYPPKYIISLANKHANHEELDSKKFSGGYETNNFLKALGFHIVEIPLSEEPTFKFLKKDERIRLSKTHHDERCPKCKKNVRKLLEKIYGNVKPNFKFEVGTHPEDFKNTPYYNKLNEIYEALQNHRGFKEFIKAQTLPNCDFFIPNSGFIVEFDESQHFTLPRKITLKLYPENIELAFDRKRWIMLCERIDAKDNDPPYRDEQRAWYDTLRDFLPVIKGLKATVRLFAGDFMWCGLEPYKTQDVEKFKSLITMDQRYIDELTPVKIVLCVPIRNQSNKTRISWEKEVAKFAEDIDADLIVFPESYLRCKFNDAISEIRKLAERIGFAALSGVQTEEGYELAVFYNPKPEAGETKEHLYVKHSTADRLAYEWPEYKGKNDPMFNPILFRGRRIGVMICHDMFFPLITDTLVKHGAEILVDLTGGMLISESGIISFKQDP